MPKLGHPSEYELPYHDAVVALETVRKLLTQAKCEAQAQADADAAANWSFVYKSMLEHVLAAMALAGDAGDPVVDHSRAAPTRGPSKGAPEGTD